MSDGMTQNQASLIGQGVTLHTPNVLPDSVKSPTWNADGTFNGWAAPVSPAGVGTELQYRNGASFGPVTGSSFVGGVLTAATLVVGTIVATTYTGLPNLPAGVGTELQYRSSATALGAVAGSGFVGGIVTLPRLIVSGTSATPAEFISSSTSSQFTMSASTAVVTVGIYTNSTFQIDCSQSNTPIQMYFDGGSEHLYLDHYTSDSTAFTQVFRKQRVSGAVTPGDQLGAINFQGYSGAAGYVTGAQIRAVSEGTIATTRVPSKLVFATGTDAAPTVLTDRMVISNAAISCSVPTLTFIAPAGTSALINLDTVSDAQYVTLNFKEGGGLIAGH